MMSLGIHTFESLPSEWTAKRSWRNSWETIWSGAAYNDPAWSRAVEVRGDSGDPWQSFQKWQTTLLPCVNFGFFPKAMQEWAGEAGDASSWIVSPPPQPWRRRQLGGACLCQFQMLRGPASSALLALRAASLDLRPPTSTYRGKPSSAWRRSARWWRGLAPHPSWRARSKEQKLSVKEKEDPGLPSGWHGDHAAPPSSQGECRWDAEGIAWRLERQVLRKHSGGSARRDERTYHKRWQDHLLRWHAGKKASSISWRRRSKSLPDQGIEKGMADSRGKKRAADETDELSPLPRRKRPAQEMSMKKCMMCKKRRFFFAHSRTTSGRRWGQPRRRWRLRKKRPNRLEPSWLENRDWACHRALWMFRWKGLPPSRALAPPWKFQEHVFPNLGIFLGDDVFSNIGYSREWVIEESDLSHWAPNCAIFSC